MDLTLLQLLQKIKEGVSILKAAPEQVWFYRDNYDISEEMLKKATNEYPAKYPMCRGEKSV